MKILQPHSSSRRSPSERTTAKMIQFLFLSTASILLLAIQPALGATTASYLPLSYTIPYGTVECLYEHMSLTNEPLTASIFLSSGEELRAAIVLEGPVAPADLDFDARKSKKKGDSGAELKRYLDRYEKEGTSMFTKGKWDNMVNVKPVHIAEMVDFEEEEEDFMDDYYMTAKEREDFNEHHDLEHQHAKVDGGPHHEEGDDNRGDNPKHHPRNDFWKMEEEGEDGEHLDQGEYIDDDVAIAKIEARERLRLEEYAKDAEVDDDFVKLQMDHKPKGERNNAPLGELQEFNKGERRKIGKTNYAAQENENHRRRLSEGENPIIKLVAGEPYQKTIHVVSPGWYRFCVHPYSSTVEAEIELRKASTHGDVDKRTGHVLSLEDQEIHSEIHELYQLEDDTAVIAEEELLQDEDLAATRDQLRFLQKIYSEIIKKQLEERRVWNWRTVKNQHLHSHLVLGNLIETIVYMGITGLQVYTIRKWFSGGPSLGR